LPTFASSGPTRYRGLVGNGGGRKPNARRSRIFGSSVSSFARCTRPHHAIVDGRTDPHEAADRYARSAGWSSALERQDAINSRKRAMREAEDWRRSQAGAVTLHGFQTPAELAKSLGVKAREYTAEEMSAGRKQVGIE
jgi:hypothetical protein